MTKDLFAAVETAIALVAEGHDVHEAFAEPMEISEERFRKLTLYRIMINVVVSE